MNDFVQVLPVEDPHCVIFWQMDGVSVAKTVCYTPSEAIEATNRFYTPGDFYNSYDNFTVEYNRIIGQEETA